MAMLKCTPTPSDRPSSLLAPICDSIQVDFDTQSGYSDSIGYPTTISSHPTSLSPLSMSRSDIVLSKRVMCAGIASKYSSSVCFRKEPIVRSCKDRARARNDEAIDGFIYQVRFKRAHRNFVISPSCVQEIKPGAFVIVEGDRGEDLGVILCKMPIEFFEEAIPTAGYRGRGFSSGQGERKFIYRVASDEEVAGIESKLSDEEKVLRSIREKVAERKLPMSILDAEFQFDRHKLTYFFEADRRIDFRELVSDLFSMYKTRIWMQQVDTSTIPLQNDPGNQLAQAAGFLSESVVIEGTFVHDLNHNKYCDFSPSFGCPSRDARWNRPSSTLEREYLLEDIKRF